MGWGGTGRLRPSPLALREPASPSGEAGLREREPGYAGGRAPDTLLSPRPSPARRRARLRPCPPPAAASAPQCTEPPRLRRREDRPRRCFGQCVGPGLDKQPEGRLFGAGPEPLRLPPAPPPCVLRGVSRLAPPTSGRASPSLLACGRSQRLGRSEPGGGRP